MGGREDSSAGRTGRMSRKRFNSNTTRSGLSPEQAYRFWSEVMQLPSYGLIAGQRDNPMISRKAVLKLLDREPIKQPTSEELGEDFC